MSGSNKFIAGLLLGAAAGIAATLFFQTEKGQEILNDLKDAALKADDKIDDLLNKGKQFAKDVAGKAKDAGAAV